MIRVDISDPSFVRDDGGLEGEYILHCLTTKLHAQALRRKIGLTTCCLIGRADLLILLVHCC